MGHLRLPAAGRKGDVRRVLRQAEAHMGGRGRRDGVESFLYFEETKRSNLKDSDFGIPEDRKFPLDTEEHVKSAIKLFGHAEESKKKSLAKKISRKATKYGIKIPETTQCYKYLNENVLGDHPNIKNIIFDLGSVLVRESSDEEVFHLLGGIIPLNTISNIRYNAEEMWRSGDFENATYEEEVSYIQSVVSPDDKNYVENVYKHIILSVKPFDYTVDLLKMLKSMGYKLYYLSNWNQASFEMLLENHTFDFLQLMDGGVVSWETGKGKPDPEFYNILFNKYNLNPDECLFFDDKEENIEAANNLGMNAYLFDYNSTYKEIMNNIVTEAFQPAEEDDNLYFKFSVPDKDIIDIKFEMDEKEKRWNSIVLVEGVAPKTLRGRSECLVIKDNMIYLDETESGICSKGKLAKIKYDVPGGGWDPNEPHDICAIRETNEEAKIDVKDVQFIDNYLSIDKERPEGCYCDGLFSKVYIGKYAGKYTGPVADVDRADIAVSGNWYKIDDVYDLLNPIHKKAIDKYFGKEDDEKVNEFIPDLTDVEFPENVNESIVMNKKDAEFNLSSWTPNGKNILFITGLSGSGKSTKAAKLAKEKDAVNIELDLVEHNEILFDDSVTQDEGNQILKEFFNKKFGGPKKLESKTMKVADIMYDAIKYCMNYASKNKRKLFIAEGIQLMDLEMVDELKGYPVIVVNTSILKSISQAKKREEGASWREFFGSWQSFKEYCKWYFDMEKNKNKFIKDMKESTNTYVYCNEVIDKFAPVSELDMIQEGTNFTIIT